MVAAIKEFLKSLILPSFYGGGIFLSIYAIFKDPKWALLFYIAMVTQPNIWYKFHPFPMGNSYLDFLVAGAFLGIVFQKKGFAKTNNSMFIVLFVLASYLSLWNVSMRFSLPLPVTMENELLADWKNYAEMILIYFLSLNIFKEEKDQKIAIIVMSVVVLFISLRNYLNFEPPTTFDWDNRAFGPFEAVGLGANEFAAFVTDYSVVFLGISFIDDNKWRRILFIATFLFALHPIFYSYSRGAYLAGLVAVTTFGVIKQRSMLLVVVILLMTWQSILPYSVVSRINMTYTEDGHVENSAGSRLIGWQYGVQLFQENPVFGVGFGGFRKTFSDFKTGEGTKFLKNQDAHNYWVTALADQGIIGIIMLLALLIKAWLSGWRLYNYGSTTFLKGLGMAFTGCVISVAVTNMFGNRWEHTVVMSYFWILWGLVDRGLILSENRISTE